MTTLHHKFVDQIPNKLEDGILYVSIPFETVIHQCCCGCGREVVTPLSPTDWSMTFDGETITLDPSIGNWSFPCKSHYFIRRNKIVWSGRFNDLEIEKVKRKDHEDKEYYYQGGENRLSPNESSSKPLEFENDPSQSNRSNRLSSWLKTLLRQFKK